MVDRAQEANLVTTQQHAGRRLVDRVKGIVDLIKGSVELGMESYDMYKLNKSCDA